MKGALRPAAKPLPSREAGKKTSPPLLFPQRKRFAADEEFAARGSTVRKKDAPLGCRPGPPTRRLNGGKPGEEKSARLP
jgi:hypothetical protein